MRFHFTLSHKYNTTPDKIFTLIRNGTLFKLTGADKILFDFREEEYFSLMFTNKGSIYGEFLQIIPDEYVSLLWSINGFDREDETDTIVNISLLENNGTTLTIEHTGIKNEQAFIAKKSAWKEILEELEKEIQKEK